MKNRAQLELFDMLSEGNKDAFRTLFQKYDLSLCFFANRYLKDMDQSRSLVQQVFVDIWEKREGITLNSSIKLYLFYSVKNRCIDFFRLKKNNVHSGGIDSNLIQVPFNDLVEEAELAEFLNSSINQLPEKCREVFSLSRTEGLKYFEIAKKLNISVKTVEMQMAIALKKLRDNLNAKYHGEMILLFFFQIFFT